MNLNNLVVRHSRESGNPDSLWKPCEASQNLGFVRFTGCISLLDSRLRGNDGVLCV